MPKASKAQLGQLIQLSSSKDLGRCACTFDTNMQNNLYSFNDNGEYNVFFPSETIGGNRLLYYYRFKTVKKFGKYSPGSIYMKESFDFADSFDQDAQSYRMPVIELSQSLFGNNKPKHNGNVINAHVKDPYAVIRGAINLSLQEESMGKIYSFTQDNRKFIATFGLLSDESNDILSYSEIPNEHAFSFYGYDYTNDAVQQTDRMMGNTFIYIRVINLAKPFYFFKPE